MRIRDLFPWLQRNSATVQALTAIVIAGLTFWLAKITSRYAKSTAKLLALSEDQLDRQQRVYIEFGLDAEEGEVKIWVANLGAASFLVSSVAIRWIQKPAPLSFKINSVVQAGKSSRIGMPGSFYGEMASRSMQAIDVSLECVSSGEKKLTKWRAFTLHTPLPNRVLRISAGINDIWPLSCSRCGVPNMLFMVTNNLKNFDQAFERQKAAENEIADTCPEHKSQLVIGLDSEKGASNV
jgi:hypothetical protein